MLLSFKSFLFFISVWIFSSMMILQFIVALFSAHILYLCYFYAARLSLNSFSWQDQIATFVSFAQCSEKIFLVNEFFFVIFSFILKHLNRYFDKDSFAYFIKISFDCCQSTNCLCQRMLYLDLLIITTWLAYNYDLMYPLIIDQFHN